MTPSQARPESFYTDDGQRVLVRPLLSGDAPLLIDLFQHLGAESRYLRFHEALENPDPALVITEAERLVQTTLERGAGWLAFMDFTDEPEVIVGGVRYVRTEADAAEVAVTVRDDLHGRGIARGLLLIMIREAYRAGVRRLFGIVQATNQGVLHLARSAPLPVKFKAEGSELHLEMVLTEAVERMSEWG